MKRGQEVYVAANHRIETYYFYSSNMSRREVNVTHDKNGMREDTFSIPMSCVHFKLAGAIQRRIQMLEKTVASMTTAIATHKKTIRQLKRDLSKQRSGKPV